MNSPFHSKTQWQMFLLVSGCHVGAHPDGHQHGAFTESALLFWVNNFLKCFACEKSYWPESWRGSFYINLISFLSFWNLSFHCYFCWRDSENQHQTKRVNGVKLVWNHTCDFKISWVRSESSIWYHKHDFRPKLHDTKFNYHLITAILKFQNSLRANTDLIDPVGG